MSTPTKISISKIGELDLSAESTPNGRYYTTPDGNRYPSVTTVLGQGNTWVKEWRAKVGDEHANLVSHQATARGSAMHNLCEKFLRREPIDLSKETPLTKAYFLSVRKWMSENIREPLAVEVALYSDVLRLAGRCDCIALVEPDNELHIIDFKTSSDVKGSGDILDYRLQATAYSLMLKERTGLFARNYTIVISSQAPIAQTYHGKVLDHVEELIKRRKAFQE